MGTTATTKNEEIIHKLGKLASEGVSDDLINMFADDAVYNDMVHGAINGHDGLRKFFEGWWKDGKNYSWQFYDVISEGDRASARWYFSYNMLSENVADQLFECTALCQFQFDGEKIKFYEEFWNVPSLLMQMELKDPLLLRRLKYVKKADAATLAAAKEKLGIS